MLYFGFIILLLHNLSSDSIQTQNLSDFQWKNRLVIVFEDSKNDTIYQKQIAALKSDLGALEERKLLLLQNSDNKITDQYGSIYNNELLADIESLRKQKDHFEILLIGLDGGVKLRNSTLVSQKNLFTLIDGMPMRKAELKKSNH